MTGRVVVLGGGGFVGRALCRRLAVQRPGLEIVVPTRRLDHAAALRTLPSVRLVQADVNDPAALAGLAAGADALVQLVAILHGTEAEFERVHVELTRRVAMACRAAGIGRVVHVSALGVGDDAPSRYLRSKARGERVWSEASQAAVVLRPSVIFGAEDRFLNLFATLQAWSPVMPLGGAGARFQPVWVEDVAEAIVRTLAMPVPPTLLECAGPQVTTLADIVRLAGRWARAERPVLALPDALARFQAWLLEHAPGPTLMSRDNVDSMQRPNVASGALPGLASIGIVPRAMADVMPVVLARRGPRSRLDELRARR